VVDRRYEDAVLLNTASLCGAALRRDRVNSTADCGGSIFNPLSVMLWLNGIGREILRTRANHLHLRLATPQSPSGSVSHVPLLHIAENRLMKMITYTKLESQSRECLET
jgi:hypothetical protein